ncbi:MAG: helicase [Planctomycetota bacterium]|nr:MAG: helicase [Planctomycetota bacterium]
MPPTRDEICALWLDALPYEPYSFQEEAILAWFEVEGGLLITAPTGMGKTLIAETAIFEALHARKRIYYTTPLIALTDQKFREMQTQAVSWGFAPEDVGLVTGNHKVNPDAPVLVVVAEILLNHLLDGTRDMSDVSAVVMDEFHSFNDRDRGVVWELSLALLPKHIRVLLLSATVGNPVDFVLWLKQQHDRSVRLIRTDERKVPLQYHWVGDTLLTDHLVQMAAGGDDAKSPALVFCFSRDECWEIAERLKGLPLIDKATRPQIEEIIDRHGLSKGVGGKLRQMLIRGVGVHHAGIMPRNKRVVEELFSKRLLPFVICTETLAAGINLPARSVVLTTIIKGPPRAKKLLPSSDAHQMFGRAGRPQFDTEGHVYAVAHEDDIKIHKWKLKRDKLEATGSKDPGILKALKALSKKQPKRRSTEQYWSEGQFKQLIEAGPARLKSRSMIPYRFLVWLLVQHAELGVVRDFLGKRLESEEKLKHFNLQLDAMLANLQAFGYVTRQEGSDDITVADDIEQLLRWRSIDPLFGAWLQRTLATSSIDEKTLALESVLPLPYRVIKRCDLPYDLEPGTLQVEVMEPLMISMGVSLDPPPPPEERDGPRAFWEDRPELPPTFPEMLALAYEHELAVPEETEVQTKWIAGGIAQGNGDFHKFTGARELAKSEGLILRHLLRFVLLALEFHDATGDPDYQLLAQRVEQACREVDPRETERTLTQREELRESDGLRGEPPPSTGRPP